MDFHFALDQEARATVSGVDSRNSLLQLTDSTLVIRFGDLFDADIDLQFIDAVRMIADPRPQTFLPMGVSGAVNTLGSDTVSVLGSHDGLVQIDLREPVQGHLPPPDKTATSEATSTPGVVMMRHLVLSLQDSDRFVQAVDEIRRAGVSGPHEDDHAEPQAWPTGG